MGNLTDQISRLQKQKEEKDKIISNLSQKLQILINKNEKVTKQSRVNKKNLEFYNFFSNEMEIMKQKKIEIAVAEEILAKNRLFEQNLYMIIAVILINAGLSALIIFLCLKSY